mmetsp:Transcript_22545/g.70882  ORF Transcript_22545/g.70882 Transcript_22545/m.70882 type:complete len:876 (-) Transcript_22545:111-2738(-)
MEIGVGQAAVGAAGAVGVGLFSYNRGNYMMDQKLHFGRYTAGLNMAIAQTGQYRQDITQLTNLTCTRMDVYHSIAAMTATILTALFCPGRLGLHTPPPPGWLMGLFMVNLAGCYLYLGLTMWLCMHASLRADSALTHMLTRFVRLPIPSQGMIDSARAYLSSFEQQPLSEAFRIPFMRHRYMASSSEGPYNEDMELDPDAQSRTRHGHDVPAWYRKEKAIDHDEPMESMLPRNARSSAPEHFEVYREIQNEWWPYDVYSRLSIFLAFMHLTHCWTYMQIGHHMTETRSVFAAACVVLPMTVLQQIILTLDIIPDKGEFPIQRIGPFAMWFGYVAAVLEYKRWYTPGGMVLSFVLVYIAYGIHVIYTIQLLRLCSPDMTGPPVPAESPGASWWPGSWCLPSAFQHSIWLVAPPQQLEPGQTDLVSEMRGACHDDSGSPSAASPDALTAEAVRSEKRKDVHRALGRQGESPAWFNVKTGLVAMLIAWIFLIIGYSIEVANQGTPHPSFISAPGMPNNLRDPRYRKAKPGYGEPVEVGTGGAEAGPAVGMREEAVERRLQAFNEAPQPFKIGGEDNSAVRLEIAERLYDLLPLLRELARGYRRGNSQIGLPPAAPVAAPLLQAPAPLRAQVQWPALFQPRLLACGPPSAHGEGHGLAAVALSRHGRGAVLTVSSSAGEVASPAGLSPFTLEGVAAFGPLIAAAWDEAGLLLASAAGTTMECPGHAPSDGRWRCRPLPGAKLPISLAGRPFAGVAAIARAEGKAGMRAAIVHPGESTMTLYSRAGREAAPWLPAGEVSTSLAPAALSLTAKEALLLAPGGGAVTRLRVQDGAFTEAAPAVPDREGHVWQATCGMPNGGVVRLALDPSDAMALEPTLLLA